MNGTERKTDWDSLLLKSEELVRQDGGFPRVERDVHQIDQFSQHLRSRLGQGDPTTSYLDASRLLAQEGVNPRQLDLALQTFEIQPRREEIDRGLDVETYVRQVHESISATAVKRTHENIISSFENHIDAYLDSTWQRQKKALFDAADAIGAAVPSSQQRGSHPANLLKGRAAKYADVVQEMNAAIACGSKVNAADLFTTACKNNMQTMKDSLGTTLLRLWNIVQYITKHVKDIPASAITQRQSLMIQGAKEYLEGNFVAHMQSIVKSHRTVAALGGLPSKSSLVEAYLRVREKSRGALDFDSPGGIDTTWARIYYCLRAGFRKEALDILSRKVKPDFSNGPGQWVSDWIENGCRPLVDQDALTALSDFEKAIGSGHGYSSTDSDLRKYYVAAICALASGSSRCADSISRDMPTMFPTIEDYLWYRLSLVRVEGLSRLTGTGSSRIEVYTLTNLQSSINQYPATHYSKGGQEPLLFAAVLLLSLQSEEAVAYLATNAATHEYRVDAVHIAICLWYLHMIDAKESSASGRVVHQYAYSLIHYDVSLSLEYYIIASLMMGGSLEVKGKLLKELLTESQAYGVLLGSGGAVSDGEALSVFFPDKERRLEVLESVAQQCAAAAQFQEAVELFMVAEKPASALRVLNRRISDAIEACEADYRNEEVLLELFSRAHDAKAAIQSKDDASVKEQEALEQLKIVHKLLSCARGDDVSGVIKNLWELPFIPTDRYRMKSCIQILQNTSSVVIDRLQSVLLAGSNALVQLGKAEELHLLVSLAASVPEKISQHAYQMLNQYQASLA